MLLEIKNISIGYTELLATDINAEVNKGELVILVGKNGVGKSTLLNVLKGTQLPITGEFNLLEKTIGAYSVAELSRHIAVVNTSRPTLKGWTVQDLLESTHTASGKEKKMIGDSLELCQIEELKYKEVDVLSDGEFQKVMIARAICQQTQVIVMDEPTAFLDVVYREHVLNIFSELKARFETTLIMSSHNFAPLLKVANQVWVLSDKKMLKLKPEFNHESILNSLKK